jgi:hypothetical protein
MTVVRWEPPWGISLGISAGNLLGENSQEVVSLANIEERGLKKYFWELYLKKRVELYIVIPMLIFWMKFHLIIT